MSKRSRSEKGKTPKSSSNPFVSQNASHRFSVIHNKHVISGRQWCLLILSTITILSTSSLEHLITIKEPVYPELVTSITLTCLFKMITSGLEFCARI